MKFLKRFFQAGASTLFAAALMLSCMTPVTTLAGDSAPDSETAAGAAVVDSAYAAETDPGMAGEADNEEDLSYRELYIRKHLDYMQTGEYEEISNIPGGLAYAMATQFEADGLETVNSIWSNFASTAKFVGSGEVDKNLTAQIHLTNEYDIIVAHLMTSSAVQDSFSATYSDSYMDAVEVLLTSIRDLLKDTRGIVSRLSSDDLGKAEDIATYIDAVLTLIQMKKGVKSEDLDTLYEDALKGLKDKLNGSFLEADKDFLKDLGNGLGIAADVAGLTADTFTKVADYYVQMQSLMGASQTWIDVWTSIAGDAEFYGGAIGAKFASSIRQLLSEIEIGREDMAALITDKATNTAVGNVVKYGISQGSAVFDKATEKCPIIQGIRKGLISGITVSNCLTGIDDFTYFSHMLVGTGYLANAAHLTLVQCGADLDSDPTMANAVAFDEAFHIYKEIQIAAIDYAISYNQAIATAGLSYVFKYQSDDEITTANLLLIEKAEWLKRECHEFDYEVINNGGLFVGYLGSIYYWKLNPGTLSQTGILGHFDRDYSVVNDLICRHKDGSETVILSSPVYDGKIFIAGESVYFQNSYSSTVRCNLDGSNAQTYENLRPVGASPYAGCLIAADQNSYEYVTINENNERRVIAPMDGNNYLGTVNNEIYYVSHSGSTLTFYDQRIDSGITVSFGSVTVGDDLGYCSNGVPFFTDKGIYILAGGFGGTGNFFYGDHLVWLDFETCTLANVLTLPNEAGRFFGFPKVYAVPMENEAGAQWDNLYVSIDVDYSDVGNGDSYLDQGVFCYNSNTQTIEPVDYMLSNIGDGVTVDNTLITLTDNSGVYATVLSTQELNDLGYDGFYFEVDGRTIMCPEMDLVENLAFFTIQDMSVYPEASVGWRTGYILNSLRTYMKDLETGEITLLYELP